MFYLLNTFKHLMRCSKYLNKFEIVIIYLISFTTMKKGLKEENNQLKKCSVEKHCLYGKIK